MATSVFSEVGSEATLNIFMSNVTRSYFIIQPSTTNRGTPPSLAKVNVQKQTKIKLPNKQ